MTILSPCAAPCPPIPLADGKVMVVHFVCTRVKGHDGDHSIQIGWPQAPEPEPEPEGGT